MDEYAARFAVWPTDGGPVEVPRSGVVISRTVVAQVVRRDPRGSLKVSLPVFSTFQVKWDFELGDDLGSLDVVLDCLCGPAVRSLGMPMAVHKAAASVELADGNAWDLESGLLRDFQIVVNAGDVVNVSTVWQFGQFRESGFPSTDVVESRVKAAAPTCAFTMGTTAAAYFSGTIAFSREAMPAGFDLDGKAGWFTGRIAVDIVGTFLVRITGGNAFTGLSGMFQDSMFLEFRAGTHLFRVTIPHATFLIRTRRVVSNQMVDYELEMLAVKGEEQLVFFQNIQET